jgi:hypothetical protein
MTRLQERLKKKLGENAFPFWFEIPQNSASSVTLQVFAKNSFFLLRIVFSQLKGIRVSHAVWTMKSKQWLEAMPRRSPKNSKPS